MGCATCGSVANNNSYGNASNIGNVMNPNLFEKLVYVGSEQMTITSKNSMLTYGQRKVGTTMFVLTEDYRENPDLWVTEEEYKVKVAKAEEARKKVKTTRSKKKENKEIE